MSEPRKSSAWPSDSPHNLAAARTRCARRSSGIRRHWLWEGEAMSDQGQWQVAGATKIPFPDAAFDIAYCQLGLQFFPDRPAALREMYRVMVPGGRLGLMVWRGIEHSPGFAVLAAALARHASTEAAGIMRAP